MAMTRHDRVGLPPLMMVSNILVWISAVIVMGILSYFLSLNNNQGDHIIYEEVIVGDTLFSHLLKGDGNANCRARRPS